jgi:putative DNA primase/helicase
MINAMRDAGIDPPAESLTEDGKLHRYAGATDKPQNKKNWYVLYPSENGFQSGAFGRWIGDSNGAIKWCSREVTEFTAEEKEAYKKRQADLRRKQAEDRKQAAEECITRCKEIWASAKPATDDHPYLQKKQVKAHGLRMMGDALLVPIKSLQGQIRGIQFIKPDGSKVFKTGTDYTAAVHMIGKPLDNTLIITEGYATAASIHEATGHAVLVAFVAGNLKAVAEAARAKQPAWELIIAADDDRWAKEYDQAGQVTAYHLVPCEINGGKRVNTGAIKGEEAAKAVKGQFRRPVFSDLSTHPTDFNDLHILEGLDAVRRQIFPPPMAEYEPPPTDDDYIAEAFDPEQFTEHPLTGAPFQLLGYDHGEYYFLAHGNGQVKALTADKLTKAHLLTLAELTWWEREFPAKSGFNEDMAKNMLIQTSHTRGIYDPSHVRGLGAWEDKNRSVLHLGDTLVVDGKRVPIASFKSKYIYERAISISDEETAPVTAAEAHKLIQLCEMLSWEKPINGRLLAGWCVASIVCGALKWRPHMWLTGPSGSGKSWIIHSIIKFIAGPHLKGMLGSTTEAGLRNALKNDAFSVFFDEFEAEDRNAAARIQSILEFARPASSNEDSKIYKAKSGGGGVNSYQPRSCIGVASINVNMTQKADISRVTVLSLVNGSKEHFDTAIMPFWVQNFTPEFARGVRARCIMQIPMINRNAEIFQRAVTEMMGSRRGGDQYGSILACAYSLCSSSPVTIDQAREFVQRHDWESHIITEDQGDELQCLSAIMEGLVDHSAGKKSLGELLVECEEDPIGAPNIRKTLARYGIKHLSAGGWFIVANKHSGISRILEKTPWAGNWAQILARLPGAMKCKAERFSGGVSRAVALPISYVKEVE